MGQRPEATDIHKLLVEETRELLCLHAGDGTFRFLSPSIMPLLGYRPKELVGTHPLELVHEEDRASARAVLQAMTSGPQPPVHTFRFRHAEGAYVWLEVQGRALRSSDGTVSHLVSSSRDVSDRVDLLERATDAEARLRSVLASFDDLVFVFDGDGVFTEYYQPASHDALARPPEAFLGRRFDEVLPQPVAAALSQALNAARCGGSTQAFEYELDVQGTARAFRAKVTPLEGHSRGTEGFVGVVQDVTQLRAAERAKLSLVRATERAERLEGLSALARGTAHEFNNLLTAIQGNTELALEALADPDEATEHLDAALDNARRAADVTQRLLRYAGDTVGRREWVTLDRWMAPLERHIRTNVPDAVRLTVHVHPETPPVLGDPDLLEGALLGMVRNAFEALPADGGAISIRVEPRFCDEATLAQSLTVPVPPPGLYVAVIVEDDGVGIDPDLLPRMLEPFVTGKFLGRGLGLAEVSGTVRSHRGAVLSQSDPGKGTTITLLFPSAPYPAPPR